MRAQRKSSKEVPGFCRVRDLMDASGLARSTITRAIRNGFLEASRPNGGRGMFLIPLAAAQAYLATQPTNGNGPGLAYAAPTGA